MVGKLDFSSMLPVKSDRVFACESGPILVSFLITHHFLKVFYFLFELGAKDIFNQGMTSQMVE